MKEGIIEDVVGDMANEIAVEILGPLLAEFEKDVQEARDRRAGLTFDRCANRALSRLVRFRFMVLTT